MIAVGHVALALLTAAATPAAPTAPLTSATLTPQLARLERLAPAAALTALVAASEAEVEEFQASELSWRITRDGAVARSALGRALAARGLTKDGDLSWFVMSAYRRRGRGETLDLEALAAETRARRERLDREQAEERERQRATGRRIHADPLEILDQITFDPGQAAIREDARAILEAIARTLNTNPGVKMLEVRGHVGRGEPNARGLAARRAQTVHDDLVTRGVAAERLPVASAGTEPPHDPAHAPGNRCVDFTTLRRVPLKAPLTGASLVR
jgi:outer membrane protein OmpA-like peptidoglycan-associated protein